MDEIHYRTAEDGNHLTFVKLLGERSSRPPAGRLTKWVSSLDRRGVGGITAILRSPRAGQIPRSRHSTRCRPCGHSR
jgi:hypothetical protein